MKLTPSHDTFPVISDSPAEGLTMADVLSARLRELLGRAIEEPETLDAADVRELAASVVFCLASLRDRTDQ